MRRSRHTEIGIITELSTDTLFEVDDGAAGGALVRGAGVGGIVLHQTQ